MKPVPIALIFCALAPFLLQSPSAADAAEASGTTRNSVGAQLGPEAVRQLAESKYLEGDLASAEHFYRELSRLESNREDRAKALVHAAWLQTLLNDPESAAQTVARALVLDPNLRVEARLFNDAFEQIYLRARVLAIHDDALARQKEEASEGWQPTPAARPDDVYRSALERLASGQTNEALPLFQRATALTYSSKEADLEIRRPALVHTGILFYQRQQWADAASAFEGALELDRSDVSVWRNLGLARLHQPDLSLAIDAFLEAYTREPGQVDHARSLGAALVRAERWDDVASWIDDATRHHPQEAVLWNDLALAHAARGATERARTAWAQAIRVDSSLDNSYATRASLHLGLSHYEAEEWRDAERVATEALDRDPRDAALWNLLGLAQQARGEAIEARQAFLQACVNDESSAYYRNNLGRAYAEAGNLIEAEEAFVHALTLEPDFGPARASLVQVRQRLSSTGG